jgi:uncharacterized protein YdeI (YjbR/CyaY-like superfamily)
MKITKTVSVTTRNAWRAWLKKHHATAPEIWLLYPKKHTGKPRVPYDEAVEEALCFGWIDSTVKSIDNDTFAQRFSPRKRKSPWSQPNIERVKRLIKQRKMTPAGVAAFKLAENPSKSAKQKIAPEILKALKADKETWQHWQQFPDSYKRIRIAYLESCRRHGAAAFKKSLQYLLKKTKANKLFAFGGVQKDT